MTIEEIKRRLPTKFANVYKARESIRDDTEQLAEELHWIEISLIGKAWE